MAVSSIKITDTTSLFDRESVRKSIKRKNRKESVRSDPSIFKFGEDTAASGPSVSWTKDWRLIVFAIFNPVWIISLDLILYVNFIITMYDLVFQNYYSLYATVIYYVSETFLCANVTLAILHRKWIPIRRMRSHIPKHMIEIVLSIVTLLPFYEVFILIHPQMSDLPVDYTRLKLLVRYGIVGLHVYSREGLFEESNLLPVVIMKHLFILTTGSMFFSAAWYMISAKFRGTTGVTDWSTVSAQQLQFDVEDPKDWMFLSFVFSADIMFQNASFYPKPKTMLEAYLVIIGVIFGFYFVQMVLIGRLISIYSYQRLNYCQYWQRIEKIKCCLQKWNCPRDLQNSIESYYEFLWKKRHGHVFLPPSFQILPSALQNDVVLDLFWDALKHSHIFSSCNIVTKRAIAMAMKDIFVMPGSLVYTTGELKTKMVYIVSGNLQFLSDEDQLSPVLTLTSGSLIGGVSACMAIKSATHVRAATLCELQVLELTALYRNLWKIERGHRFLQKINDRIISVKVKIQYKDQINRANNHYMEGSNRKAKSMVKLKSNFRNIMKLTECPNRREENRIIRTYDGTSSFQFLDALVVNDDANLKSASIFLKNKCPLVFGPNCKFKKCSYVVSLFATFVNLITLPYLITYVRELSVSMFYLCFLMDLCCWFELLVQGMTAVITPHETLITSIDIIYYRLKETSFVVDLIACCPIDYIFLIIGQEYIALIFKANRLIFCYKLYVVLKKWDDSRVGNMILLKIVKYLIYYAFFTYLFGCVMFLVATTEPFVSSSWFTTNVLQKDNPQAEKGDAMWSSILLSLATLIRFRYHNFIFHNLADIAVFLIVSLMGILLYVFFVCDCVCTGLHVNYPMTNFFKYIKDMEWVLRKSIRNPMLFKDIQHDYDSLFFQWKFADSLMDNTNDLDPNLIRKIQMHRLMRLLENSKFFKRFKPSVLKRLTQVAKVKTYFAESVVISRGVCTNNIFIIERGVCMLNFSNNGREKYKILRQYDTFPVIEALFEIPSYITVIAECEVDIVFIPVSKIINYCRNEKDCLTDVLDNTNLEDLIIQTKKPCAMVRKKTVSFANKLPTAFEVIRDSIKAAISKVNARNCWTEYIFMEETINPHGKFFTIWETVKCSMVLFQFAILYLSLNVLFRYSFYIISIQLLLDIYGLFDIYIRMHVQYHDERGLLISDVKATSRHYLRTSFAIDVIGIFPFRLLLIDQLFFKHTHFYRGYHVHVIFSRIFQIYRVLGALNYVIDVKRGWWKKGAKAISVVLSFYIVHLICINALYLNSCTIDETDFEQICDEHDGLISYLTLIDGDVKNPFHVLMILNLAVHSFFGYQSSAMITFADKFELQIFIPVFVLVTVFRQHLIVSLVSYISGDFHLYILRTSSIKRFQSFAYRLDVVKDLAEEVIEEHKYQFTMTRNLDYAKELSKLDEKLTYAVFFDRYWDTLKKVNLLEGDDYCCKALLPFMKVAHYIKGAQVIQINDVQNHFYILHEGELVAFIENDVLDKLKAEGAWFGSLNKRGFTRHTINITAKKHTELIYFDTIEFVKIAHSFPRISKRIQFAVRTGRQYEKQTLHKDDETEPEESKKRSRIIALMVKYLAYLTKPIDKLSTLITGYLFRKNKLFRKMQYYFYIHFTPLSCVVLLFFFIFDTLAHNSHNGYSVALMMICIYLFDVIFLIRMVVDLCSPFDDPKTGDLVQDKTLIRRRYIKSYAIYVDVISSIPYELVMISIVHAHIGQLVVLNRILRMVHFYVHCKILIKAMKNRIGTLIWAMVYSNLCFFVTKSMLWASLICPDGIHCNYYKSEAERNETSSNLNMLIESLLFSTQLITQGSLVTYSPAVISHFIFYIIVFHVNVLANIFTLSSFANIFLDGDFSKIQFYQKVDELKWNLEQRDLSISLVHKVKCHFNTLWNLIEGEIMPKILQEAPPYLKQKLMAYLYGKHLKDHHLFRQTHVDFIRQLTTFFENTFLLPGDLIVESGAIDGCIYFIHAGLVQATVDKGDGPVLYYLKSGDSFGEVAGILHKAHEATYSCITAVDLLTLRKRDWLFLLEWFPASNDLINQVAEEMEMALGRAHMTSHNQTM